MNDKNLTGNRLSGLEWQLERASTIQKRIEFLANCEGSVAGFSKKVGISVSGLKRYLQGGEPTASKIIQISNALGISATWLLTGQGKLSDTAPSHLSNGYMIASLCPDSQDIKSELDQRKVKVYDTIASRWKTLRETLSMYPRYTREALMANNDIYYNDNFSDEAFEKIVKDLSYSFSTTFHPILPYEKDGEHGTDTVYPDSKTGAAELAISRHVLSTKHLKGGGLATISITGDSMEPTLSDGDIVVIDRSDTSPTDGNLYALSSMGETHVKRFQNALGVWNLISDNSLYGTISLTKQDQADIEIVGRVVFVGRY
ncbi:helix-turn-helix domain-containing protein, partial [Agarivorans sp. B2Z047]